MTHKDIFTKFMIEYDKANVTSSYPSLTEYEIATFLDKAYMALIAQKVTGNNVRRAPFEADVKSISDLQGLVISCAINLEPAAGSTGMNIKGGDLPQDFLYFVSAFCKKNIAEPTTIDPDRNTWPIPADNQTHRILPVRLTSHSIAEKFYASSYNIPWIKIPMVYIEKNKINVVLDPISQMQVSKLAMKYIKHPNLFVKDDLHSGDSYSSANSAAVAYAKETSGSSNPYLNDTALNTLDKVKAHVALWDFELDDVIAEELISLAISYALENVESPRLNTHLGMRGLES